MQRHGQFRGVPDVEAVVAVVARVVAEAEVGIELVGTQRAAHLLQATLAVAALQGGPGTDDAQARALGRPERAGDRAVQHAHRLARPIVGRLEPGARLDGLFQAAPALVMADGAADDRVEHAARRRLVAGQVDRFGQAQLRAHVDAGVAHGQRVRPGRRRAHRPHAIRRRLVFRVRDAGAEFGTCHGVA